MKQEQIKLEVEGASEEELKRYKEVLCALISTGGLIGVKGGQTIIHFDAEGTFMSIQLSYRPWVRRKNFN
jgi:hypothetical protein